MVAAFAVTEACSPVVLEGVAVPLIHTAWLTALLFSLANAALLTVRIRCEENALARLGEGAEALAAYGLKTVKDNTKPSAGGTVGDIYPSQPWAQPVGPIEVVPGVTLEATLEDMQGRFNVNWLVNSTATNANNGQIPNPVAGTTLGNATTPGITPPGPNPGAVKAFNKLLELIRERS